MVKQSRPVANSWIMALKHWNSMKGGPYKVPKRGTKEYKEVKKIQNSMINGDGLIQLGKAKQTSGKKKGNGLKQSKAKKIRPKKGNGLLDMALSNPQETMDISKVLSGAYMPPPPKIVDGKLQIQKGPIDNLLSSIFG